jgi:heme-degrading monooxygenase HmoA
MTPGNISKSPWHRTDMSDIAQTPLPPYYAVIFTSHRTETDDGYGETAQRMLDLAAQQPGFLGVESARNEVGITVSYWRDLDSIKAWKAVAAHREAQANGRQKWYSAYKTRICLVERDYEM